jgi:hypothetical protein
MSLITSPICSKNVSAQAQVKFVQNINRFFHVRVRNQLSNADQAYRFKGELCLTKQLPFPTRGTLTF